MICFKKQALAILFLLSGTSISSQELSPSKPTNYIAASAAAATAYGVMNYASTCERNLQKNNPYLFYGVLAAKIAAASFIAWNVYDYATTLENFRRWPNYAAFLIKEQITDYKLLALLDRQIHSTQQLHLFADTFLELKNHYANSIENCFVQLEDIGFQICDDQTIEMIHQLRAEMEQIKSNKIPLSIDLFVQCAQTNVSIMSSIESLFSQAGNLALCTLARDNVECAKNCIFIAHFFEQKLTINEQSFAAALVHCKRIDTITTAGHIVHGAALYAQWRLSEWWQGK